MIVSGAFNSFLSKGLAVTRLHEGQGSFFESLPGKVNRYPKVLVLVSNGRYITKSALKLNRIRELCSRICVTEGENQGWKKTPPEQYRNVKSTQITKAVLQCLL
jgi:hypothetical protein